MIPNLTDMDQADLRQFWARYHRPTQKDAVKLIGDDFTPKEAKKLAAIVANYAINKVSAMVLRIDGKIDRAMVYEAACDTYYGQIPKELQW